MREATRPVGTNPFMLEVVPGEHHDLIVDTYIGLHCYNFLDSPAGCLLN
jgi:hypothetical protein